MRRSRASDLRRGASPRRPHSRTLSGADASPRGEGTRHPFSLGETVAGGARRMRAASAPPRVKPSETRCSRAPAHRGRRRSFQARPAGRRGRARRSPMRRRRRAPASRSLRLARVRTRAGRCWRRRSPRQAPPRRPPARRARQAPQGRPRRASNADRACPRASLVIFAGPPAMVRRGTGCSRRYFSRPPTKSPISISA